MTVLLSLLEGFAAIIGFYEPAPAGGVRIPAPSEVFLYGNSVLIKPTLLDMLQIPMTALRAGYFVVHGYRGLGVSHRGLEDLRKLESGMFTCR